MKNNRKTYISPKATVIGIKTNPLLSSSLKNIITALEKPSLSMDSLIWNRKVIIVMNGQCATTRHPSVQHTTRVRFRSPQVIMAVPIPRT